MRFLVTGGAGFIGSHLVEALLERGHDVVVLDDLSTGRLENIEAFLDRVTWIEASVTDPDACAAAMAGVDFVLHQAAIPSVPRSVADPVASHAANTTGTLNILLAARDAGVRRVVYAASSSAYGNSEELPKHEAMAPNPLSPYAAAKLTGEHYCRAFHASYGLGTIALRYFNVFGPRQDPESPYAAVVPRFIACALRDEPPTIFGDGSQTRDFTYVENVVHANLLACEAPAIACGQVFNVGCGTRISILDLWHRIRRITGATVEPIHAPPRPGDVHDSLASLERTRTFLGYQPTVPLDEGLQRTITALAAGLGIQDSAFRVRGVRDRGIGSRV